MISNLLTISSISSHEKVPLRHRVKDEQRIPQTHFSVHKSSKNILTKLHAQESGLFSTMFNPAVLEHYGTFVVTVYCVPSQNMHQ